MPRKNTARCKTSLQGQTSWVSAVNWTAKDIITANSLSACVVVWLCAVFLGRGGPGSAVTEKATELQRQKEPCRMHNTSTSFVLLFGRAQNEGRLAGRCLSGTESLISLSLSLCLSAQMANPTPEGEITMVTAPCHACLWMLQCRSAEEPHAPMATPTRTASCSCWIRLHGPIVSHSVRPYLVPKQLESTIDHSLNMPLVFRPI